MAGGASNFDFLEKREPLLFKLGALSEGYFTEDPKPEDDPLTHPTITQIAQRYGKSPAQVILRWHIELGHSVIPKSVHTARIRENVDIFDFALSAEEIAFIDGLDTGRRGGPDPKSLSTKTVSFTIPD